MFRLFDWSCGRCSTMSEALVEYPMKDGPPDFVDKRCETCVTVTRHLRRRVNRIAAYLGEKPMSPRVKGGHFDTVGYEKAPPLPEFTGTTGKEFREFCHSKPYLDAKAGQAKVKERNALKRKRAAASKRDPNLSFRHHPLPGDPNWKD